MTLSDSLPVILVRIYWGFNRALPKTAHSATSNLLSCSRIYSSITTILPEFYVEFSSQSRASGPVVITLNSHASSGPSQINQEIRLLLWRNWSYIFKFYRLRAKYEMYTHLSINCFIGVNQHLESQWYCIVCTVQRVGLHPWSSDFGRQSLQMFA